MDGQTIQICFNFAYQIVENYRDSADWLNRTCAFLLTWLWCMYYCVAVFSGATTAFDSKFEMNEKK